MKSDEGSKREAASAGKSGGHRRDDAASLAEKLSAMGRPCRLVSLPRLTAPVEEDDDDDDDDEDDDDEVAVDSAAAAPPISAASPVLVAPPPPPPPLPASATLAKILIRHVGQVALTRSHSSTHWCKAACNKGGSA